MKLLTRVRNIASVEVREKVLQDRSNLELGRTHVIILVFGVENARPISTPQFIRIMDALRRE
ncbi:MAG: hypothetical protein ACREV9_06015 [Burkholderiales bacterium]